MAQRKRRVRNRLADWLVFAGVRTFAGVLHVFPIDLNLRTARLIGTVWFHTIRRHRQRAMDHLRASFDGQYTEAELRRIALRSFQQLVMMAMEVLFEPRLIKSWNWGRRAVLKDLDEAFDELLGGRNAILVTGHYGSFELLGFLLATVGLEMVAVMRPLDNPYLNDYLLKCRYAAGLDLLYKKGAAYAAGQVIETGRLLCFIADQNAGRKGLFVDFFGRKASTYRSIGLLAMHYEVPVIVGYARRTGDRFHYQIGVNRIIRPEEWRDRPDPLVWITQEYTRAIEDFVREDPTQYLWIHRRWKTRPPGEA